MQRRQASNADGGKCLRAALQSSGSAVLLSATSEPTSADAADQGLCLTVSIGLSGLGINMR
ncbi:unnamed protein product [Symbiodinium sp. CCMP2592]|nr:unnamed protein product [Symbiodinium sp. CCMP2592]